MGRRARLLFAAAGRARPDQRRPWAQTGLDRKPPHSNAVRTGVKGDKRAGYMGDTLLPRRSMLLIR